VIVQRSAARHMTLPALRTAARGGAPWVGGNHRSPLPSLPCPTPAGGTMAGPSSRRGPSSLLFVSISLTGHLSPALAVAAAAAARQRQRAAAGPAGAAPPRVRFAALSDCRAKVEAAGLEFVDLGAPSPELAARAPASTGRGLGGLISAVEYFAQFEAEMFAPLLEAAKEGGAAGDAGAVVADFVSWVSSRKQGRAGAPGQGAAQQPAGRQGDAAAVRDKSMQETTRCGYIEALGADSSHEGRASC
jgi:hypothetical protein